MSDPLNIEREALERLVTDRTEVHWPAFAAQHPHLARAISRIVLVEVTVDRLASDPKFRAAVDEAARDQTRLNAAAEVSGVVDRWVRRLIGV
jgi:hypothetical protein